VLTSLSSAGKADLPSAAKAQTAAPQCRKRSRLLCLNLQRNGQTRREERSSHRDERQQARHDLGPVASQGATVARRARLSWLHGAHLGWMRRVALSVAVPFAGTGLISSNYTPPGPHSAPSACCQASCGS